MDTDLPIVFKESGRTYSSKTLEWLGRMGKRPRHFAYEWNGCERRGRFCSRTMSFESIDCTEYCAAFLSGLGGRGKGGRMQWVS